MKTDEHTRGFKPFQRPENRIKKVLRISSAFKEGEIGDGVQGLIILCRILKFLTLYGGIQLENYVLNLKFFQSFSRAEWVLLSPDLIIECAD